jgi:hypothetical protein
LACEFLDLRGLRAVGGLQRVEVALDALRDLPLTCVDLGWRDVRPVEAGSTPLKPRT